VENSEWQTKKVKDSGEESEGQKRTVKDGEELDVDSRGK
jgi:hypothetical protein